MIFLTQVCGKERATATTLPDGTVRYEDERGIWYEKDGKLHREDGPALEVFPGKEMAVALFHLHQDVVGLGCYGGADGFKGHYIKGTGLHENAQVSQ